MTNSVESSIINTESIYWLDINFNDLGLTANDSDEIAILNLLKLHLWSREIAVILLQTCASAWFPTVKMHWIWVFVTFRVTWIFTLYSSCLLKVLVTWGPCITLIIRLLTFKLCEVVFLMLWKWCGFFNPGLNILERQLFSKKDSTVSSRKCCCEYRKYIPSN